MTATPESSQEKTQTPLDPVSSGKIFNAGRQFFAIFQPEDKYPANPALTVVDIHLPAPIIIPPS